MKRYRWTAFYIDTERNIVKSPFGSIDPRTASGAVGGVTYQHGLSDIQDKYERWLSLSPPSLCVPVDWHELLLEVESAYVHGDYYPALTSACCLGERILNHLVIGLRSHFTSSDRYKEVARKDSFQNWNTLIDVLSEWRIVDDTLSQRFAELLDLRNPAVHFGSLSDRQQKTKLAVDHVYYVTSKMFGLESENFFRCDGEVYVCQHKAGEPLAKEFIVPHCHFVGYKHRVENRDGKLTIVDDGQYADSELSDEEFIEYRKAWSKGEDKAGEVFDAPRTDGKNDAS
jgi:hypothetical protein